MRAKLAVGTAALWILALGCAGSEDDGGPFQTAAQPIFGGQNATTCQWPTTVLLSGCTGTLVHPQIVTTAAHCGSNHRAALFGESRTAPARRVAIEYCRVFPNHRSSEDDRAFCKLATPVTDVPIAPILMGCEVDVLKAGQKVVVAGFGDNDNSGGGYGIKRWVETTLRAAPDGNGVRVGGNGHAPCFGDSGGPAFVQLNDGSWRSFGIDSVGLGQSCGAGDRMSLMHKAVPWIEQQSGIDITPCHDADGTWNPGPRCQAFSLAPSSTNRTWASGCAEPALSPPAATCGAPIVGSGDGGAPPGDAGSDRPAPTADAGADAVDGAGVDAKPGDPAPDSGGDRMTADAGFDATSGTDGAALFDGRVGATIPKPNFDALPRTTLPPTTPTPTPVVHGTGSGCALAGQEAAKSSGYALGGLLALALAGAQRRRTQRR